MSGEQRVTTIIDGIPAFEVEKISITELLSVPVSSLRWLFLGVLNCLIAQAAQEHCRLGLWLIFENVEKQATHWLVVHDCQVKFQICARGL